jgi:hypothetical protein
MTIAGPVAFSDCGDLGRELHLQNDEWFAAVGTHDQEIVAFEPIVESAESDAAALDLAGKIGAEQRNGDIAAEATADGPGKRDAFGGKPTLLQIANKRALCPISLLPRRAAATLLRGIIAAGARPKKRRRGPGMGAVASYRDLKQSHPPRRPPPGQKSRPRTRRRCVGSKFHKNKSVCNCAAPRGWAQPIVLPRGYAQFDLRLRRLRTLAFASAPINAQSHSQPSRWTGSGSDLRRMLAGVLGQPSLAAPYLNREKA